MASQPRPSTPSATSTPKPTFEPGLVPDDDTLGELEGITHTDNLLYLVSRSRNLVFHATRSTDGSLRVAGALSALGVLELRAARSGAEDAAPEYPFVAQPEDHCETPAAAYADIAPFLARVAALLGRTRATLRIWDPYYCAGGAKRELGALGFAQVRNECEDFYKVVSSGRLPKYDCIVTNPPYSTDPIDHVERLVKFLCGQSRPWFVVQPNYVYTKPFWGEFTVGMLAAPRPFFLTPSTPRKYKYRTPVGLREISAQQLKTSPFVSMWYCWVGAAYTEELYRWTAKEEGVGLLPLSIACSEFFLPDCFKDSNDKTRRKPRKSSKKSSKWTSHPAPRKRPAEQTTTPHANKHKKRRANKP